MKWIEMQDQKPPVSNELLVLQDRLGQAWVGYSDGEGQIRTVTSGPLQSGGYFSQRFTHVYYRYFKSWARLGIQRKEDKP